MQNGGLQLAAAVVTWPLEDTTAVNLICIFHQQIANVAEMFIVDRNKWLLQNAAVSILRPNQQAAVGKQQHGAGLGDWKEHIVLQHMHASMVSSTASHLMEGRLTV